MPTRHLMDREQLAVALEEQGQGVPGSRELSHQGTQRFNCPKGTRAIVSPILLSLIPVSFSYCSERLCPFLLPHSSTICLLSMFRSGFCLTLPTVSSSVTPAFRPSPSTLCTGWTPHRHWPPSYPVWMASSSGADP